MKENCQLPYIVSCVLGQKNCYSTYNVQCIWCSTKGSAVQPGETPWNVITTVSGGGGLLTKSFYYALVMPNFMHIYV